MDRLTSLAVFAKVAETGVFSLAAKRLNMSTTMVSNHVQALENRLGARLLNSSRAPSRFSSAWTWLLTMVVDMFKRLAAKEKTPVSATLAKTARLVRRSIIIPYYGIIISQLAR